MSNTHRGIYQYVHLLFGVASAPAVFQRVIKQYCGDCSELFAIRMTSCFVDASAKPRGRAAKASRVQHPGPP